VEEIPPRLSVPPERSGGGQFPSKNVRAKLYNSTNQEKSNPRAACGGEMRSNYFKYSAPQSDF